MKIGKLQKFMEKIEGKLSRKKGHRLFIFWSYTLEVHENPQENDDSEVIFERFEKL